MAASFDAIVTRSGSCFLSVGATLRGHNGRRPGFFFPSSSPQCHTRRRPKLSIIPRMPGDSAERPQIGRPQPPPSPLPPLLFFFLPGKLCEEGSFNDQPLFSSPNLTKWG